MITGLLKLHPPRMQRNGFLTMEQRLAVRISLPLHFHSPQWLGFFYFEKVFTQKLYLEAFSFFFYQFNSTNICCPFLMCKVVSRDAEIRGTRVNKTGPKNKISKVLQSASIQVSKMFFLNDVFPEISLCVLGYPLYFCFQASLELLDKKCSIYFMLVSQDDLPNNSDETYLSVQLFYKCFSKQLN